MTEKDRRPVEEFFFELDQKKGITREIVYDNDGEKVIMTYDFKTGNVEFTGSIETQDKIYKPAKRIPWELCHVFNKAQVGLFSTEDIFNEIKDFLIDSIELPQKYLYDLMSAWVLYTWVHEAFDTATYIHLLGKHETGKSRLLEILSLISFHGYKSSSPTEAALARDIDEFHVVPFLDEVTLKMIHEKGLYNILNSGYRKGDILLRVSENNRKREYFSAFSPKVLAGRSLLDQPLMSKCLSLTMKKNFRQFKIKLDTKRAATLRLKLLLFRLFFLRKNHMSDKPLIDIDIDIDIQGVQTELFGRLGETFHPIVRGLSGFSGGQKLVFRIYEALLEERKTEKQQDEEYDVILSLKNIISTMLDTDSEKDGFLTSGKTKMVFLSNAKIKQKLNENVTEKEKVSSRMVANYMTRLGFKRERDGATRGFSVKLKRYYELCAEYDIPTMGSMCEETDDDFMVKKSKPEEIRDYMLSLCCSENMSFFEILSKTTEKFSPLSDNEFDAIFNAMKSDGLVYEPEPGRYRKV
jgi:hypothetical protein